MRGRWQSFWKWFIYQANSTVKISIGPVPVWSTWIAILAVAIIGVSIYCQGVKHGKIAALMSAYDVCREASGRGR